jgi:hypothetical protein
MELHLRAVLPALILSGLGGFLAVVRYFGATNLVRAFDMPINTISPLLTILALVGFLLFPILALAAGYFDGLNVDLVENRGSLVGLLLVSGLLGHVVGYVLGLVILAVIPNFQPPSGAGNLIFPALQATIVGAVSIALAGVAGAGLGYLSQDRVREALGAR